MGRRYRRCVNILACVCPCGPCPCLGKLRYVIVAMSFFSILVTHCQRAVLSIAIVEMVGTQGGPPKSTCPTPKNESHVILDIGGGKMDWNEQQQNLNLASFYIGYLIMHVPAGIICDIYGARYIFIGGIAISTICTGLVPTLAMYTPWWSIFILRIILGFGQSVQYPALSSLVGRWIPSFERATVTAIVFASNSIGYIVATLCSGMMIKYFKNWTVPFYVWSAMGVLFLILALLYLFSDPRTHPFLSPVELEYLQSFMVQQESVKLSVKAMAKDWCVYGLIMGQTGHDFIMFTLANNLPKYLNNVLGFDIELNSLFSFAYLAQLISAFIFGVLADLMIKRNANVCLIRKVYTNISLVLPGLSMLGMGLVKCDVTWVLILIIVTMFFNGMYYCGLKVHIIDVAVNHAGLLMAIINGMGAVAGFFSSFIIGYIAKDNTHEQWFHVFLIMLTLHIITGLLYTVTTSCHRRPWDYKEGEKPELKRRSPKCYLELSPSAFALRQEERAKAEHSHQENLRLAKLRMKASFHSLMSGQ